MTRKLTRSIAASDPHDAIALLTADHEKVKQLFTDFKELNDDGSDEEKSEIVEKVCNELTIHAQIEEDIFYPAVRKAIEDSDLMDEALVEHAGAKSLIAQLRNMDTDDELYDAKVTVLGQQIDHHVKEEEGEMFPQARRANVDMVALGAKMLKRKQALMAELGIAQGDSAQDGDEDEDEVTTKQKRTATKAAQYR